MDYVYSAKNNVFFPVILLDSYIAAGWDTSDAVPVEESVQIEFTTYIKDKICTPGADGLPMWADIPVEEPPEENPQPPED